jgi:hypothetical protein
MATSWRDEAMTFQARAAAGALIAAALVAAGAASAAQNRPRPTVAQMDALEHCIGVTEDAARLACYDQAVKALTEASKKGQVVVVDEAGAREVHKQAFGFAINLGPVLGFGKGEQVNTVSSTLAGVWKTGDGHWIVRTAEGQVWRQIDSDDLFNNPKVGQKLEITRGAIGSYFMTIGDDRPMRVHRDE